MIKTFRGLLADGAQDRIRLSTIKGKVGYRIVKFQIITTLPGTTDYEQVIKIFNTSQTSITEAIDFTDSDLLAVAYTEGGAAINFIGNPMTVIFDQEIFNQDIFISHFDAKGAYGCNYYLELEVVPLDNAGAEYTTLKDMRSR